MGVKGEKTCIYSGRLLDILEWWLEFAQTRRDTGDWNLILSWWKYFVHTYKTENKCVCCNKNNFLQW